LHISKDICKYANIFAYLLPPKYAKYCKIPRKFELTAVQGHPRSMILVPIEGGYANSH